jgi:hypothetical protein
MAASAARATDARLLAVHVLSPDATDADREQAESELRKLMADFTPPAELHVSRAGDIVSGLLRQARGSDLIVTGGTEAGFIEYLLGYAVPFELAERAPMPVITVYEMPADPKRWMN